MSSDPPKRAGISKDDVERLTKGFKSPPNKPKRCRKTSRGFIKKTANPNEGDGKVGGELNLLEDLPFSARAIHHEERTATMEALSLLKDIPGEAVEHLADGKATLAAFLYLEAHQGPRKFDQSKTALRRLCLVRQFQSGLLEAYAALEQLARVPDILTAPSSLSLHNRAQEEQAMESLSPSQDDAYLQALGTESLNFLRSFTKTQLASLEERNRRTVKTRFDRWRVILKWRLTTPSYWLIPIEDALRDLAAHPEYKDIQVGDVKRESGFVMNLVEYYDRELNLDIVTPRTP